MGKTKFISTVESSIRKSKKILKQEPLQNKISIKKFSNDKEIIAEFPLIKNSQGQQVMSIPIFRKDKLHYTPGFCLPDQFTTEYRTEQQLLHQYRLSSENSMVDVENIRQPKPSSRNSYCTICKVRFEDYKEHIQLDEHVKKMNSSPFCKQIAEMAAKKKIQRFFTMNDKNDKTDTNVEDKMDEVFSQQRRVIKRQSSDSKEQLYEKISRQFLKYKAISNNDLQCELADNLFDVLC